MGRHNLEMEEALARATADTYSRLEGDCSVDVVLWEHLLTHRYIDKRGIVESEISADGVKRYLEIRSLAVEKIQALSVDPPD